MQAQLKHLAGPWNFFSLLGRAMKQAPGLRKLPVDQRIGAALREKISLVVTGVNRCRYCTWLHTRTAMEAGLSAQEVRRLLAVELENLDGEEAPALLYAQYWADRDGAVEERERERLRARYGESAAQEIETFILLTYFGNLCSNTVVSYREQSAGDGRGVRLFVAYLLALPVANGIRRRASHGEGD